ncbi:Transposon Ty3-I Gag-Pol polyprotein [Vitis vinifera]|uniref:Transposon Ty3-I Gag-Pol polyprotein n=1 Tax=Vitis vinifera TaxID=29760 RepID=A0A438H8G3_VITVI|nr:Transposon Ty3-I Gag-Pol polyprotein [Vitis vinifera]
MDVSLEFKSLPSVGYSRKSYLQVTSQRLARDKLVNLHGRRSLALPSVGPASNVSQISGNFRRNSTTLCKMAAKSSRNKRVISQRCAKFFLQLGSDRLAMAALYGIEEGIDRGLWPKSFPFDPKGKKPSGGQRLGDMGTISSYRPTRPMAPTNLHQILEPVFAAQLGMPLSRAFQKLMEAGLLTQLAPRLIPSPCHLTSGWICIVPTIRCNHEPSIAHSTHAVLPPWAISITIDFVNDDNMHMMSWDDVFPELIVLDDGYEVDTIVIHSGRVAQPPPLVARPFDGAVSHEEQIHIETTTTPKGLIHMMTIDKATCIMFSDDDLPPEGSDHTRPLYITVGCSGHRVPSVLLDNGLTLNVCPLATAIALGYAPLDFGLSTQTVLRIPTFFNLLLGRPWIHRAGAIPSSLHQKVKFIYDRQVITVQSLEDMFASFEPVFQISHTTVDRDTLFGLGFVPIETDYRYMARLHRERVRARLTCTPFDYPVCPYRMCLVDYFIRGSELGDETSGTLVSVMISHSSLDRANLLFLCFLEETIDCGVNVEPTRLEPTSLFDLFGVPAIEVVEEIQTVLVPDLMEDVIVGDDLFKDTFRSIEGASEFVDPPLSFDILSGFISCSDDVCDSTSMDLNRDSFDHDSDPIDERVSPAIGDVETIDFDIEDQPRELKIGSPLSTDESDTLIHLLSVGFISVVEYPKWLANVVHVPKKNGKVRVCVDFRDLNKASPKDDFPLPHIDLLVDNTAGHLMLSFMDGFSGYNKILMALEDMEKTTFITEWVLDMALGCMLAQLDDSGKERAIYYLSKRMLEYEMRYVMIERLCLARSLSLITISEGRSVNDDFPNEEFIAMTSLSATLASSVDFPTDVVIRPLLIESRFAPTYYYLIGETEVQDDLPWYYDIYQVLRSSTYPDATTAKDWRALRQLATRFMICGETLYRRSTDDCCQFVQKCLECQIHGDLIHAPPSELHALTSPWPFSIWGIDIIGKISLKSSSGHEFILVAIDYFTKWVEAASYARLTSVKVANFIRSHIICRYGGAA